MFVMREGSFENWALKPDYEWSSCCWLWSSLGKGLGSISPPVRSDGRVFTIEESSELVLSENRSALTIAVYGFFFKHWRTE